MYGQFSRDINYVYCIVLSENNNANKLFDLNKQQPTTNSKGCTSGITFEA